MYWLGGAFGCATGQLDHPNGFVDFSQSEQDTIGEEVTSEATRSAQTDTPPLETLISETEPSLRGLDRSHWSSTTVVKPVDGSVAHGWLMFKDVSIEGRSTTDSPQPEVKLDLDVMTLPAEDFSRVHKNAVTIEEGLINAIKGTRAQNWSQPNSAHLVVQPVKMSVDLATFPFRHIVKPGKSDADKAKQRAPATGGPGSEETLQP